jgi:hypothetical protein
MTDHDHHGRPARPENPRSEPEIIRPEHGERGDSRSQVWVWVSDGEGLRRAAINPPGPLTVFLVLGLFALIVAIVLAVFLGAVLIWIPVLVVVLAAALVAAAVQRRWRQFRHWLFRR